MDSVSVQDTKDGKELQDIINSSVKVQDTHKETDSGDVQDMEVCTGQGT